MQNCSLYLFPSLPLHMLPCGIIIIYFNTFNYHIFITIILIFSAKTQVCAGVLRIFLFAWL